VGVKNYPNVLVGLAASAKTLQLSYYNNVRANFAANNNAITIAEAIASSPWGTRDAVPATQYCMGNTNACCTHPINCPGFTRLLKHNLTHHDLAVIAELMKH
jgi:hypothetical protein